MAGIILIVEDDRLLLRRLTRAFSDDGFEVISVLTVKEGIEKSEEESPDLILLDLNLPDGSGFDVLRNLKETERSIPAIVMTGEDYNGVSKTAFRLGAYDFLEKPFSTERLKKLAQKAMKSTKNREKEPF